MTLQKQLYAVGIFEEEIVLSDFTSGVEKRFIVEPAQLQAFFRSEVTFRPFLGLVWMKTSGDLDQYLFTLPGGQRTIIYRQGKKLTEKQITLPPLLVKADISNQTIKKIDLWAMAGRTFSKDTALYSLPLPNINSSSLCLGNTIKAAGNDIRAAVERTIFDTPFNHHADHCGKEGLPFHAYVKKYKGTCPLRTLTKMSPNTAQALLGGRS